jgi:hypothetical protein
LAEKISYHILRVWLIDESLFVLQRFVLPPPPLKLPPPPSRHHASADVALARWRHRRCHCRHAAVKLPPTSPCRAAAITVASALLPLRCRRHAVRRRRTFRYRSRRAVAMLPPTLRCRAAATAAASALLPPRCRCRAVRRRHHRCAAATKSNTRQIQHHGSGQRWRQSEG